MSTRIEMAEKASKAVAAYVQHIGYKILDRDYMTPVGTVDIVASDPMAEQVVFISTAFGMYECPDDPEITRSYRKACESRMMSWMREVGKTMFDDFPQGCRYDQISIGAFSNDRALIRHHKDVLGTVPAEALELDD